MKKLQETVDMMCSSDYKERLIAEYEQLAIRMFGLRDMLIKYKAGTLLFTTKCSYELLMDQYKAMDEYMSYLIARANIEDITLPELIDDGKK